MNPAPNTTSPVKELGGLVECKELGDTEVVANTKALRLVETGGDGLGAWLAVHLIVDVQGWTRHTQR